MIHASQLQKYVSPVYHKRKKCDKQGHKVIFLSVNVPETVSNFQTTEHPLIPQVQSGHVWFTRRTWSPSQCKPRDSLHLNPVDISPRGMGVTIPRY